MSALAALKICDILLGKFFAQEGEADLTPLGPCLHGWPPELEKGEVGGAGYYNDLLGEVLTFSLPPVATCPGATDFCRRVCYVKKIPPYIRRVYEDNYIRFLRDPKGFVSWVFEDMMVKWRIGQRRPPGSARLRKPPWRPMPKLVRLHVSGDFFSEEYVEAWYTIAKDLMPDFRFWAYTRSWRVPSLKNALERLRSLPNVTIYASTDPETGPPPPGWLEAGFEGRTYRPAKLCTYDAQERAGVPKERRVYCRECGYCAEGRGDVMWAWE